MSNILKTAGHLYKKQLENWLSKPPFFQRHNEEKSLWHFLPQAFGADEGI
mgnify:CR=1 FL=1